MVAHHIVGEVINIPIKIKDPDNGIHFIFILEYYYPPEVSSMKHCHLGVFRKEYFRLVNK